jgi:hypothetical protein
MKFPKKNSKKTSLKVVERKVETILSENKDNQLDVS